MEVNRCRVSFFVVVVVLHLQSLFCFFFITATFFSCAFILPSSRFQFCWFFFLYFFFSPHFLFVFFFFFSLSLSESVTRMQSRTTEKEGKENKMEKEKEPPPAFIGKMGCSIIFVKENST